jgi:transcription elongation factor S-II
MKTRNHRRYQSPIIMKTIANPSGFRDSLRRKFKERLLQDLDDGEQLLISDDAMNTMSINLERGIYNCIIQKATSEQIVKKWSNPYFVQIYTDHARSIYINLGVNSIRKAILSRAIKAQDFPFMTHQEMIPEKWSSLLEQKRIRDKNKYEVHLEASTDNFLCYKCKSRECTYYQMQTRSADEPMTTFVTCIKCGNRWKC